MIFGYALFAASILIQSAAQILEKKGLAQLGQIEDFGQYFSPVTISRLITNPYIDSGICLSLLGLFCWLGALTQFKVSYLYSIGSVSYIVVSLLAWWLLAEDITITHWTGIAVIIIGCVIVNL